MAIYEACIMMYLRYSRYGPNFVLYIMIISFLMKYMVSAGITNSYFAAL